MIKEVTFLIVICGCAQVYSQMNPMAMMMMAKSMGGGAGGAGGATGVARGGGAGGMMMGLLNNPFRLCKETDNVKAIPCRGAGNQICNLMSIRTYGLPNLFRCSPMGFGCCFKDFMSLMMAKQFA